MGWASKWQDEGNNTLRNNINDNEAGKRGIPMVVHQDILVVVVVVTKR